jgi:hypothetical protein
MAISFLPLDSEQRGGKEAARGRPAGGDCRRAGPRWRSGCRVKRRGRQGGLIPLPTLGCVCVQRRILGRWRTGGGGARGEASLGCLGRRGVRLWRCGVMRGARRGPFIAAGKAVTRPAPCTRTTCGRQWWRRRFGKAPGVDSAGGIRGQIGGGAVGRDPSCRGELQRRAATWSGRRVAVALFGGGDGSGEAH